MSNYSQGAKILEDVLSKKPIYNFIENKGVALLYDTGTNQILQCSDEESYFFRSIKERSVEDVLSNAGSDTSLQNGIGQIASAIKEFNILSLSAADVQFGGKDFDNIRYDLEHKQGQLILEVTDSCNLRCKYCVHGSSYKHARSHGKGKMSDDIARMALDQYCKRSSEVEQKLITFYGGEPLLNFDLISKSVAYARGIFGKYPIEFGITTNGVLLTDSICGFMAENNFNVLVSIDGPKEVHDSNRVDVNGGGTFDRAMAGLERLVSQYEKIDKKENISLSMVYAPPYFDDKFSKIASFLHEYPAVHGLSSRITYPAHGSIPAGQYREDQLRETKTLGGQVYLNNNSGDDPLFTADFERMLARIAQRPVSKNVNNLQYPGACCEPGVRRSFVRLTGEYCICERMLGSAPTIGHVSSGIDVDKVEKIYVDDFLKKMKSNCSGCWGQRLCSFCYCDLFGDGTIDFGLLGNRCSNNLNQLSAEIIKYDGLLKAGTSPMLERAKTFKFL